jgi:hypothetical protein
MKATCIPACCACGTTDEYHLGFCLVCDEWVCDLPTCTGKCKCDEEAEHVVQPHDAVTV